MLEGASSALSFICNLCFDSLEQWNVAMVLRKARLSKTAEYVEL